jgi:hypothetical protein
MAVVTLQERTKPGAGSGLRTVVGAVTGALYILNPLGQVTVAAADQPYLIAQGFVPLVPSSGQNVGVVDFGAFPGSNYATATFPSGLPADSTALLQAFVIAADTVDHSADEHVVDGPIVSAVADGLGNVIINAYPNNNVPKVDVMMPWGKWSVGWAAVG